MIRVGVFGAAGRMGATVCDAVLGADGMELVAAVDPHGAGGTVPGTDVPIAADAPALLDAGAEVVVDFTVLAAARENVRWCAAHDVHAVVGTTGFSGDDLDEFAELFTHSRANALVAPNFAIGAVLMMRFSELAAPWFETAEIIELHHDNKIDAPSGTAMTTARRMTAASEEWGSDPTTTVVADGARGGLVGDAIRVHSVRMRGVIASQEVLLGTTGQTLSIRHDTFDRWSFMPGVLLGVRRVSGLPDGLTLGLDALLETREPVTTGPDPALRERLLEAAYECVARYGLAKTTVEDVVKQSGVSRATVYRVFPGGKDELMRAAVGWEMSRFFGRLAEAVAGAADFASLVESGLVFAHAAVHQHEVLQKVLVTEPDRLLPLLTTEQEAPLAFISGFLLPYLEREQRAGRVLDGVDLVESADFVARMILSLVGSHGRWDLDDPAEVRELVRTQLLAGVLTPDALAA